VKPWLSADTGIEAGLAGLGFDVAVLRLRLSSNARTTRGYGEDGAVDISRVLNRIWEALPVALPGNFQIIPDLRLFMDGDLYLIKPRQLRYWLRSSALADAAEIVADLHRASRKPSQDAQTVHADR
jgi:hypothetical protein